MNDLIRILLAEDDLSFGTMLKSYLEIHDYQVTLCQDGKAAVETFKNQQGAFDLCVLDVMMPFKDGYAVAREIVQTDTSMSFIFLTAKSLKEDIVEGYRIGAQDYIIKPFDSEILLLKMEAILRRKTGHTGEAVECFFEIGQYQFDYEKRLLMFAGKQQQLSPKEAELLKLLCLHKPGTLKREEALMKIWKEDTYFTARSMDVFITKLRKYLSSDGRIEIINLREKGFRLVVN